MVKSALNALTVKFVLKPHSRVNESLVVNLGINLLFSKRANGLKCRKNSSAGNMCSKAVLLNLSRPMGQCLPMLQLSGTHFSWTLTGLLSTLTTAPGTSSSTFLSGARPRGRGSVYLLLSCHRWRRPPSLLTWTLCGEGFPSYWLSVGRGTGDVSGPLCWADSRDYERRK